MKNQLSCEHNQQSHASRWQSQNNSIAAKRQKTATSSAAVEGKENSYLKATDSAKRPVVVSENAENGSISRRVNSKTFSANPSRAVHHWQSNLDKEIESQQLSSKQTEQVLPLGALTANFQTISQEHKCQPGRKVQTIMLTEQQKTPLTETLLQFEQQTFQPTQLQTRSTSCQQASSKKTAGVQIGQISAGQHRNATAMAASSHIYKDQQQLLSKKRAVSGVTDFVGFNEYPVGQRQQMQAVDLFHQPVRGTQLSGNQLLALRSHYHRDFPIKTDNLVFKETTSSCLNSSEQNKQPRQATQIRLENLISETENYQSGAHHKENLAKFQSFSDLTIEAQIGKGAGSVQNNLTSKNQSQPARTPANCSMAQNHHPKVTAGVQPEQDYLSAAALAVAAESRGDQSVKHHKSLGRMHVANSAAPRGASMLSKHQSGSILTTGSNQDTKKGGRRSNSNNHWGLLTQSQFAVTSCEQDQTQQLKLQIKTPAPHNFNEKTRLIMGSPISQQSGNQKYDAAIKSYTASHTPKIQQHTLKGLVSAKKANIELLPAKASAASQLSQRQSSNLTSRQEQQESKPQFVASIVNNSMPRELSSRYTKVHHVVISQDSGPTDIFSGTSNKQEQCKAKSVGKTQIVHLDKSFASQSNSETKKLASQQPISARSPQVKMKVFDGYSLMDGSCKPGSSPGVQAVIQPPPQSASANNQQNRFHANPIPSCLKKMSNANQSLDRYLQRTTTAIGAVNKSERPQFLSKNSFDQQIDAVSAANLGTLISENDLGIQLQTQESACKDEAWNSLQTAHENNAAANQAIFKSLEVLEECSNEGNSPGIKQKKGRASSRLRKCSSSPTNFINCSSKSKSKRRNRADSSLESRHNQSKTALLMTFEQMNSTQSHQQQQITLSNQKNKIIRMRDVSSSKKKHGARQDTHGSKANLGYSNKAGLVDTREFTQLTNSITELQQQINSGVFIAGTSSNLQPLQQAKQSQVSSDQPQALLHSTSGAPPKQLPSQQPKQQFPSATSSSTQMQQQQAASQILQQQQQQWRQQQQQQQQQMHQHIQSSHSEDQQHLQNATTSQQFRGVAINGQNHPPHLSQQAQQMLSHKLVLSQQQQQQQQLQQHQAHQQQQIQSNAQLAQQQQPQHQVILRQNYHGVTSGQPAQQLINQNEVIQVPYNSKAQTQKVVIMQNQAAVGSKGVRALASANSYKQSQQHAQQTQQSSHQQMLRNQLQGQQPAGQILSPNAASSGLRPGSNHRVLVPVKQPHQQQQLTHHQQLQSENHHGHERQLTAQPAAQHQLEQQSMAQQADQTGATANILQASTGQLAKQNAPTSDPVRSQQVQLHQQQAPPPRTYKEIRQRLHQQQQMQQLRLQQQQWIARQQQILLANNPGATIEQVNAIIQQSIINQQQQMALQQQQAQLHALQQATNQLQNLQSQPASSGASGPDDQASAVQNQASSSGQSSGHAVFQNVSMSNVVVHESADHQGDEPSNQYEQQALLQQRQQQAQLIRMNKKQQNNLVGSHVSSIGNSFVAQQQVQIKQHGPGGVAGGPTQSNNLTAVQQQLQAVSNQRNITASSQQNLPQPSTSTAPGSRANGASTAKDENLMSYAQLLKQECQYEGGPSAQSLHYRPNQLQQNLQPTNLPLENLKHALQQVTSEILRKVLARSDSMNQLRQIIDLKAKKVKPKNYESSIFQTIMDKEQTRVKQESDCLAKQGLRVEDKTLIKYLRGQVKKMLKPFRGLQYDDFLNNEIHLNEIMATQDQQNDPIKESRKRHLRILDAALKEQVVDIHIVLGICVQISRQAFYNELQEYFVCAYDYIMANQAQFQQHDIQGITNLKKKLGSVRSNSKVQIQTTKKLDRMFWLLLEQNQEVRNNIRTYKERYIEKTENGGIGSQAVDGSGSNTAPGAGQNLNSASHLQRRQNNNLRSSSGINTASPKVNAGGSSHNIFASQNQKIQDSSVRRTIQKGSRTSSHQQETYNGASAKQIAAGNKSTTLSQSQDANDQISLHATAGKGQLLSKTGGKNSTLAPIPGSTGKKAQSLIQKKMKARDLDRQLNSQHQNISSNVEKTPDHSGAIKKRRMSSSKAVPSQTQSASQQQAATPQNFHPRSRTKHLTVINSTNNGAVGQHQNQNSNNFNASGLSNHHQGGRHGSTSNNSTENLFNLIQATKTKNTMILEPLSKRHKKTGSIHGERDSSNQDVREEMGSGLQSTNPDRVSVPIGSQKSHRMRQTDYSRGFMSNLDTDQNVTAEMDPRQVLMHQASENPNNKVFRSWSRPQIGQADEDASAEQQEGQKLSNAMKGHFSTTMQVCTCARYRKRIEPGNVKDITVAPLASSSKISKTNSQTAKSELGTSPDHPRGMGRDGIRPQLSETTHQVLQENMQAIVAGSEYRASQRKHSQEEIAGSPNDRKSQPRASQDFKMRILTKKKVAVPASATSQSRTQYNESNTSSASLEHHPKVLGPNRQISAESGGVGSSSQLNDIHTAYGGDKNASSMLQRSKIVTYELCQECGGQRPAGLPQMTSSLSEIKVKLQVSKVSGYHSSQENELSGTARLNDSERSSTLSLGDRNGKRSSSSAKHRSRADLDNYLPASQKQPQFTKQNLLGHSVKLERVKAKISLENCLNKRYLAYLGVHYHQGLQDFIINSRAARIQLFFRERLEERVFAAEIIQKRWRIHQKNHEKQLLRRAKIQHLRKKVAINRIYDLHRLIKVQKVTANSQLMQHQLWQSVQQSQEVFGDIYLQQIVTIQRRWRAVLSRKFLMGKVLVAKKQMKERIWNSVMTHKYRKTQCLESRHLFSETMFVREKKNLEGYFWKQMVGYAKDLETRAAKIEQRLNSDFVLADWTFDSAAREWQNSSKSITIKLEKHEASQFTVLRDKLVQFYVSNQLPSEGVISKNLDDFVDARTAMQKALKKEQDYKKRHMLQRIKRQRIQNLFVDEPDIMVEQV